MHLAQAEQLRQWNRAGNSEAVVSAFESGRVANTEEAMGEYVKALVRLDRLDNTRLLSTLQRGANGSFNPAAAAAQRAPPEAYGPPAAAAAAPWYAASMPAFMGGGAAAGHGLGGGAAAALGGAALAAAGDGGAVGTNRNPLVITHAEPSVTGQFMRLLRSLGLAFVLVTAAGAFLDEKTLGKGLVNSPELKPMTESKTK
jgi:ATP-dependent metalloprotease